MDTRIAFLGLGRMGLPMALRLLDAGYPVATWNRSPAAREQLRMRSAGRHRGLTIADTAAEAVRDAALVITMLADGPAVHAVLFGSAAGGSAAGSGAAAAMMPGAWLVDMSSIPPAMARAQAQRLAECRLGALDAPVSGGVVGAEAGTLAIMAGGPAEGIAAVAPVLACLGRLTHVGPAGAGQLAKLANQVIVGITIGAVAEALLLAARGGADPAAVRNAIRGGFAESRILELHGARMLADEYVPGGSVRTQLKDLATALDEAVQVGLELPITSLLRSIFAATGAHGDGDLDHAALLRELARSNGLPEHGVLHAADRPS